MLIDDDDVSPQIVNVYEFFKSFGMSEHATYQIILHMLLTRTYAVESDARECADELGFKIPYIIPGNGVTH